MSTWKAQDGQFLSKRSAKVVAIRSTPMGNGGTGKIGKKSWGRLKYHASLMEAEANGTFGDIPSIEFFLPYTLVSDNAKATR